MSALERLTIWALILVVLAVGGRLALHRYGDARFEAGQAAAVAAGERLRQAEAERNRETETNLRAQLHVRDVDAHQKEQTYAANLEAAQRRVRAGTDRLRCPAGPVPAAAASADRPAAGGPAADGGGADLMPEAASDVLGDGATAAGLVRKYARLIQRFEACRAVNARP